MRMTPVFNRLQQLLNNKWFLLFVLLLTMTVFLWGAPQTIDYPQFDESGYFFRAINMLQGNWAVADLTTLSGSPLQVIHYAIWYTLLHTSLVYPWIFITTIVLLGVGSYLMFSRVFHPLLSWFLATLVVVGTANAYLGDANYYLGPGILWCGLGLLSQRAMWQRAVGIIVTMLACYVRPELILVNIVLIVAVIVFEYLQVQRKKAQWGTAIRVYFPVALVTLVTAIALIAPRADNENRSMEAFVWNYVDYVRVNDPARYLGPQAYGTAERWVLFRQDFGDAQSIPQAILNNPGKELSVVAYQIKQLWELYGTATFNSMGLVRGSLYFADHGKYRPLDSLLLALVVVGLCILGGTSARRLRKINRLKDLPIRFDAIALISFLSLIALVPLIVIVTPWSRFFLIYPLVLLPVGILLTIVVHRFQPRRWLGITLIAVVLLLIPRPFTQPPNKEVSAIVDFVRRFVPDNSTLISQTAWTFRNYLYAEGKQFIPVDSDNYVEPVFVNASYQYPTLDYILTTPYSPFENYERWIADFEKAYPDFTVNLIAQDELHQLKLFHIDRGGANYRQVYIKLPNEIAFSAPSPDDIEDETIIWQALDPGKNVQPVSVDVWGVSLPALMMASPYEGIAATMPTQVSFTIPPSWSEKTLVMLGTLDPYGDGQPTADGVQLDFSLESKSDLLQQTTLNNYNQMMWIPITIKLPAYESTQSFSIRVQPRQTPDFDTIYLYFVGIEAAKTTGN